MKYSINSNGFIVAERDIYSLGGFIPKGSVGAKVANEDQISQDGECWVENGDISFRPDVRVKDNAYIGNFVGGVTGIHTDGITEFSGNTLVPGRIIVRNPIADPVNNFFCKDSFIGISMDVLCGPVATDTAFPFEQGLYSVNSAAGTLFANMVVTPAPANSCRGSAVLRLGKETKIYVPNGLRCQVLWGYYNTAGQAAYSGRYTEYTTGLHTISDPVYGIACLHFWGRDGNAMTPADLLARGAKILGHINSSLLMDIRPESVSGQYVMDNSSFIISSSNFGLATTQLWFMAGGLYNTTTYALDNRAENKIFGTFHSVQRLEYDRYLSDSYRTNVNRDRFISAYDCPLLRVDNDTYDAFAAKGDLVLRRCIVPKASFQDDVVNGNTYEDIDFSYANEDLGYTMTGYTRFVSSHKQGIYSLSSGGPGSTGFVSHKGNLADTARLYQAEKYIPLDGSIMEQGAYGGGSQIPYESSKSNSPIRVRTGKPLPTFGLVFPSLPDGYSVKAFYYLDDGFIIRSTSTDPTGLDTTYPYFVVVFGKTDDSAINVTDFIALNRTLRIIDHTKAPEITGSAYVGAGCTVRGDVKLIGDPYVNRVLDVNMWERGGNNPEIGKRWDETFNIPGQFNRFRLKELIPVEPGGAVSRAVGGNIYIWYFDENGTYKGANSGWVTSVVIPNNVYYIGAVIGITGDGLLTEGDIAAAGIKYVRAFGKRRYITNELDRTSPEDILIGPDYWEQGELSVATANAGKPYEELKIGSPYRVRLKRPFGFGAGYRAVFSSGYSFGSTYLDAVTKLLYGSTPANMDNALFTLVGRMTDSPTTPITPADVTAGRLIVEFTQAPRIVAPYGQSTLFISGPKIRMYDNAVLSRNLNQEGEIVLRGDAVGGYDFNPGSCMCSNGHSDAIIKLP